MSKEGSCMVRDLQYHLITGKRGLKGAWLGDPYIS